MPTVDHVAVAPATSGTSLRPSLGRTSRLAAALAAAPAVLTDSAVLAFALWTVLYHVALPLRLPPSVTFLTWLVAGVALVGVAVARGVRSSRASTAADGAADDVAAVDAGAERRASGHPRGWLAVVLAAATVAAVTAGLANTPAGDGMSWWIPAVAGAVAGVGVMLLTRRAWIAGPPASLDRGPTAAQSAYALVVSGMVALSSLFLARNTPDDVYYVGKSVWVAERDIVPRNDFLFSENVLPGMASLPPTASIEVLAGALARFLGLHAGTALFFLMLPVMAALAVLALWRLTHRWAPRRPLLAFSLAVAYLYLVAGADAALGTFHLPRLHEGKGMFVSAAIPLMWLYLTRWFDNRRRADLVLIGALSITAIGLTTTAAIILPMLVGAAAFAMLMVGHWKPALVAGIVALAYPVGSVVLTQVILGGGTAAGADAAFYDAEYTYRRTLEIGIVGVVSGLALWCGPLLARRGTPALLAAGGTLALSVLLVPGVLELISALSGISVVLWRVPWLLALPTLIGLLCTVELPVRSRTARAATGGLVAAVAVAVFAVWATPMWSPRSYVEVYDRPVWKMPQQRQEIAFWIERQDRPDGLLLAPSTIMRASLMVTSEVRVVLPRDFYLVEYDLESQFARDRLLLAAFADGRVEDISDRNEVQAALDRLEVGTICVYRGNQYARDLVPELGFTQFAQRGRPGAMVCFRRG